MWQICRVLCMYGSWVTHVTELPRSVASYKARTDSFYKRNLGSAAGSWQKRSGTDIASMRYQVGPKSSRKFSFQ